MMKVTEKNEPVLVMLEEIPDGSFFKYNDSYYMATGIPTTVGYSQCLMAGYGDNENYSNSTMVIPVKSIEFTI